MKADMEKLKAYLGRVKNQRKSHYIKSQIKNNSLTELSEFSAEKLFGVEIRSNVD